MIDSHCHLTDAAFDADRAEVVARAREAGVEGLVCIASDPDDALAALAFAHETDGAWCTAGIHPHEAADPQPEDLIRLRALVEHDEVVAIGECGLDFHYDHSPRATQLQVFEAQVALAEETGLPLVVHSRTADDETESVIRSTDGRVSGVLHCFTGGEGLFRAALEADWYVSFSGLVTFKRFDGEGPVRAVPADRLLVETDAPYLAPAPHRGRRNEPALLRHTVEALAGFRGEDADELGARTARNAARFYRLPLG